MQLDSFTVGSDISSWVGGYPVGQGIVFISNSLWALIEDTTPFHSFSENDYNKWRQERIKNPKPL